MKIILCLLFLFTAYFILVKTLDEDQKNGRNAGIALSISLTLFLYLAMDKMTTNG